MTGQKNEMDDPTAKILFRIKGQEGPDDIETLWAFDLGADQYRIDNCPFYAYGVSLADVVFAPFDPDERFPTFRGIVRKAGNRTIRVIFDEPAEPGSAGENMLQELVQLGCGYEGANKRYIAINIPPAVDLNAVVKFLVARELQWEHADPTYAELYPD